jgi:hypothetical protein
VLGCISLAAGAVEPLSRFVWPRLAKQRAWQAAWLVDRLGL